MGRTKHNKENERLTPVLIVRQVIIIFALDRRQEEDGNERTEQGKTE